VSFNAQEQEKSIELLPHYHSHEEYQLVLDLIFNFQINLEPPIFTLSLQTVESIHMVIPAALSCQNSLKPLPMHYPKQYIDQNSF
jgi:hypothetical protein